MNKNYIILIASILILSSCTIGGNVNQITSVSFSEKQTQVIASGETSNIESKLVVVCFNRYFNEDKFGKTFNFEHRLDTVNYRKDMLVEIFLEQKMNTERAVEINKIEENRDLIKIHYQITEKESDTPNSPFIIVKTPKSKKTFKFIENGKELNSNTKNTYIKN